VYLVDLHLSRGSSPACLSSNGGFKEQPWCVYRMEH
jgi:hypothetical protein